MAKKDFREQPTFKRGRAGELRVAQWLKERGWYVVPSYDYSGENGDKAPRLMGLRDGYPVPDLDVCREGNRQWVEVKTKKKASLRWTTGELNHGIDRRLYEAYMRVVAESGTPCWIAIYEESTGKLLVQSLERLGPPRFATDRGTQMAYWDVRRFHLLHTFGPESR